MALGMLHWSLHTLWMRALLPLPASASCASSTAGGKALREPSKPKQLIGRTAISSSSRIKH
jgi:hypothetical protein